MTNFQDKVVVVTGAGSGIGRATAKAFAQEGARVHLVDIHKERLEEALADIQKLGGLAFAHPVDCTNQEALEQLAAQIFEREGRVDILHNNAGVCCGGKVAEVSIDDWQWSFNVNVWAMIYGVRAFVPRMIQQGGGGHIINTASMAGLVAFPFMAPYNATKFAAVGLSESLYHELAVHGIRVTVVCPGAVQTNVLSDGRIHIEKSLWGKMEKMIQRRAMNPDKVAKKILKAVRRKRFLVTPAAGELGVLFWLKQHCRGLYYWLMRAIYTKAQRSTLNK